MLKWKIDWNVNYLLFNLYSFSSRLHTDRGFAKKKKMSERQQSSNIISKCKYTSFGRVEKRKEKCEKFTFTMCIAYAKLECSIAPVSWNKTRMKKNEKQSKAKKKTKKTKIIYWKSTQQLKNNLFSWFVCRIHLL